MRHVKHEGHAQSVTIRCGKQMLTQFHEDILIDGGVCVENYVVQQQRIRDPHASNNKMIVTKPEHKKPNERHKI